MQQADASTLVAAQIEHDTAALIRDGRHRGLQLGTAVTPQGPQDVAREALGVHTHEYALPVADVSGDQGHMADSIKAIAVVDRAEGPEVSGEHSLCAALHVTFAATSVSNELADGHARESVILGEGARLTRTEHVPCVGGELDA